MKYINIKVDFIRDFTIISSSQSSCFGRWRHEVQVRLPPPVKIYEAEEDLVGDWLPDALYHPNCCVVAIRETFVRSLPHEDPLVVLPLTLYYLVVEVLDVVVAITELSTGEGFLNATGSLGSKISRRC